MSCLSGISTLANFTGRGCGGVNSFDSTPIHSQQYSCIKSVDQNKFCNYARRTEKNCQFLFHEAQKRDSQNRETPESLRGKKQQKHVCLVAFQTQTQNRSVLATLLPNRNSHATSQIATLPQVLALKRSSKSQIAARYAAFWHAVSQIALASFLKCP